MSYYIYILHCKDNSLYTGITNNLPQRLAQHRNGCGAKYTRGRAPLTLVYLASAENRSLASVEEARIKKLSKREKNLLIASMNPQTLLDAETIENKKK